MDNLQTSFGDHSDSDSGDSWILLENNSNSESEQESFDSQKEGENLNVIEKDDDTDGISIISESEPEPCELIDNEETVSTQYTSEVHNQNYEATELQENQEVKEDLIENSTARMKTYVHRRNKKLSTILNYFVFVSVIMAAGVAIGHMWGVRDDCVQQSSSSINKILSNLYKLQEENAFLKYKIKELVLLTGIQNFKTKGDFDKVFPLQQRCKKVFEESLANKNVKSTKCVDPEYWNESIELTTFDRDNLIDLNKIRMLYKQNKSRLDNEVPKALMENELSAEKKRNIIEANKWLAKMKIKYDKQETNRNIEDYKIQNNINYKENQAYIKHSLYENSNNNVDSLKSTKTELPSYHSLLHDTNMEKIVDKNEIQIKEERKKKTRVIINNTNEEYRKGKPKKRNSKKSKKENNKEEPKLKGEYGYNDLYSSHVENHKNEGHLKITKNKSKFKETDDSCPILGSKTDAKKIRKDKQAENDSWYEKRAKYRMESRKKVFSEYSLDDADWYFRRMYKREQKRAKPDNSTYKKAIRKKYHV